MRLFKTILICSIAFTALLLAVMLYMDSPPDPNAEPAEFTIHDGETTKEIGLRLKQIRFIRNHLYFLIMAKTSGRTDALKSGTFDISGSMTTRAILDYLATSSGRQQSYRITIPEGFTASQTASRLEKHGLCSSDEFMNIVNSPSTYGIHAGKYQIRNLEGFLFPETYFLDDNTTCEVIAQRMLNQFFKVFSPEYRTRAAELGLSVKEAVTMASLIEKEAKMAEERALISGVLYNRLRANMLLQCDATIQYVMPEHRGKLYYKHLEIDSPYNTYLHKGLPPGPICNPGKLSIKAALYPEKTKYYYYVARSDGSHIFSRSNEEHIRAKRQARKTINKR